MAGFKDHVIDIQHERMEESQRCNKLDGEVNRMKGILSNKDGELAKMKAYVDGLTNERNS